MTRQGRTFWAILLSIITPLAGCAPSRTFYFLEDGDLSHYKHFATEIQYPDVDTHPLAEVQGTLPPPTLGNLDDYNFWDLRLEEAMQIMLANSKVLRLLPGAVGGAPTGQVPPAPDNLLRNPEGAATVYDPALQQTNPGVGGRFGGGVETALSAFDAQLAASMFWEHNEQPRNVRFDPTIQRIFPRDFVQDRATFQAELAKTAATGTRFAVRNNTIYDQNNSPTRDVPSDYTTNVEVEARQPLLQGAGVLFNRIAGPGFPVGSYNGVVIARINSDITLADFEAQVLNQVRQLEDTYWDLYFAYRALDAAREGRDAVLQSWQTVRALGEVGALRGGALDETRARQEYFAFKAQVEDAWCRLLATENRLRYLMGLSPNDGRLIRPADEPVLAKVDFNWCDVHAEALVRNVNLRRQKWRIKRSEMELIASRNFLLPRLDGVARYRWLGLGDELLDPNGPGISPESFTIEDTNAFATLTDGNYQEWELGLQFNMPIGFRRELAAVRNAQLQLARDRAVLQDQELEVTNLLVESLRNLGCNYALAETNFNRRIAAEEEVAAAQAIFEVGFEPAGNIPILDRLLDAQRRAAEAEREFYRVLIDYTKSISDVHFRKGSLLEYNNIYLAEGPWPAKAYHDAIERARERDAGLFIDYGYTRPSVISRGPYAQHAGEPGLGMVPAAAVQEPPAAEEVPPPREEMPIPAVPPIGPPAGSLGSPGEEPSVRSAPGPRLSAADGARSIRIPPPPAVP